MADRLVDNPNWQNFAAALETDRGLPAGLLKAVALNETAGGAPGVINATSSAGANGMFQFIPSTAKQYNVNVADAADSTRGAADYLADLMGMYKDPHLAAAAYNWGQGNLDKAIAKAKQAGVPVNALAMADKGLLPSETANYVRKLPIFEANGPKAFSADVVNQTRAQVLNMASNGLESRSIVDALAHSAVAPMIKDMRAAGVQDQDIVAQIGVRDLAKFRDAQAQGAVTRGVRGAGMGLTDLTRGGKQLLNIGDQEKLKQEQLAAENDPERRAVLGSTAGQVGYVGSQVAPLAALDLAAPEIGAPLTALRIGSTVARGAGLGAMQGALTPTTQDGQRTDNVLHGAAFGGGAAGALTAVGAGIRGAAGVTRGMSGEEAAARVAAAEQAGLPVGAADISPTLRGISNQLGKVPGARILGGGNDAAQEAALANQIAKRFGQNADTIDSNVISAAQRDLGQQFDNALDGVTVNPATKFTDDLDSILTKENAKLPSLQNKTVKDVVEELKTASNAPMEAKTLQTIRSDIGKRMSSANLEPEAKQALGEVQQAVEQHLQGALPKEKLELWKQTNNQWRHLQAAENLQRATNDSGEGLAKKLASAIKQGQFKTAFERGQAPYQDLLDVVNTLNPSAKAGPLDSVYSLAGGLGVYHNPLVAAGVPLAAGLRRLLNSSNPTIRNALLGIPTDATEQAATLTRAITGRAPQVAAAPDNTAQQRALANALASQAAQSSQAAGLVPVPQVPHQQLAAQANQAAMQQALAQALAKRVPAK